MDREEGVVIREDAERWFEIEAVELPIGPQGPGWYIAWFTLPQLLAEKRTGAGRRYYKLWESQLPSSVRFLYLQSMKKPRRFWKAMGFHPVYHPQDPAVPDEASFLLVKDLTGAQIKYAPYFEEEYDEIADFYAEEISYQPNIAKLRKVAYKKGVYVQALTSVQKKLKQDYLLEKKMVSDKVPTFDEVWKKLKSGVGVDNDIFDEYSWKEADDEEILYWLDEHNIDFEKEEPGQYKNESQEDYQKRLVVYHKNLSKLIEQYREPVSENLTQKNAEIKTKENLKKLYNDSVNRIRYELDGKECWRTIVLPVNIDPTLHKRIGIYWAYEEEGADAYAAVHLETTQRKGRIKKVTFRGRIDDQYIDKMGTILANSCLSWGKLEKEVRFYKRVPIYIYDIQLQDGTVLDINDWRTT